MKIKILYINTFIIASFFLTFTTIGQNVTLNILTQNSGIIKKGGSIFLEVTVNNMSSKDSVPAYKLKPKISVPPIVSISNTGHDLPKGWTITSNTGSEITLSNGTDRIPIHVKRTILILLNAKDHGGPSTISGQMSFSNGVAPGLITGSPTTEDNPVDNISTTTCKIIK